jgi:uncharacterized iron-regulated membrane protein
LTAACAPDYRRQLEIEIRFHLGPGLLTLRRVLFWMHLAAGSVAGLVILVMSVTGVLLMYEKQLVAWADDAPRSAAPAGAERLPLQALLEAVRDAYPTAPPTAVTVSTEHGAPLAVTLGREGVVFVDPYDGRILGEGSRAARQFFQAVTGWHRWLGAQEDARPLARAVTGASNLAFLFLVLSGAVLWWPRERTERAFRAVALFRRGLEGRARDFNWHNVTGLWLWMPLVLVVSSAVAISYPWAGDLLHRALGEKPPPRGRPSTPGPAGSGTREPSLAGLDRMWARAQAQVPGWQTITFRLPADDGPVAFSIDTGRGAIRPDRRAQLVVARDGAVVRFEDYARQSPARRVRGWLRFIHTGEAFGLPGQTLAGLASAGGALLVWTGLALAWRRFVAWRDRHARRADAPAAAHLTTTLQGEPQ